MADRGVVIVDDSIRRKTVGDRPTVRRPLRIAILGTRGIPARYGGFETFAEQLSVRLVQRGYDVTVYAESEGPPPPDANVQGVRVRYRRRPRWGAAAVIGYDCSCLWDARHGYDLVYMLGYGAAWACWWPRLWGTPVWINVDGLEWARSKWSKPVRWYLRAMEWVATRVANRLIADAHTIAQRMRQRYPGGAPCTTLVYGAELVDPAGVDPEPLSQWGLRPQRYALVVARAEPENHVLEIVEGYRRAKLEEPLVVVGDVFGDGAYQRRLRASAGDDVLMLGALYDRERLRALRAHAWVYIHGHSVGGTNPSLLESMGCGSLVIAHDNPFNREVAGPAAEYFIDAAGLAAALRRLRHEADGLQQRRRRWLQARVRRRYQWQRIVDGYERLLESQLNHGQRAC